MNTLKTSLNNINKPFKIQPESITRSKQFKFSITRPSDICLRMRDVINSCTTRPQLHTAENYCCLLINHYARNIKIMRDMLFKYLSREIKLKSLTVGMKKSITTT